MFTEDQLRQLGEVMEQKLAPLERRMAGLASKEDVAVVDRKIDGLGAEMHAGFDRLAHDIAGLVNHIGAYIDKRLPPLEKRVDRLEEHVGLSKPQ